MFKLLALLFMTIDHLGVYFAPFLDETSFLILRTIGRLAFPMFAYSIVKGIYFTKNIYRYLSRLTIFAILTQVAISTTAFLTVFRPITNVLFTFILGILFCLSISALTKKDEQCGPQVAHWLASHPAWRIPLCIFVIVAVHLLTYWFDPDYDFYGLYTMLVYKLIFDRYPEIFGPQATQGKTLKSITPVFWYFLAFNLFFFITELPSLFPFTENSIYPLLQHVSLFHIFLLPFDFSGKKPAKIYQYSFYFYYPAHICLLMLFSNYLIVIK